MIIGIDASRANVKEKTGTEWYAYHLIEELKKITDPHDQFILYSKEKLEGQLDTLPPHFSSKILRWPPGFLWTQIRLAWEMLWHRPDILFVPAHTMPIIHPKKTIVTLHDIGFEHFQEFYSKKEIGPNRPLFKKLLKLAVKTLTAGKYSNTELDYHRWSTRFSLKHAEKIITISQFSKNEIIRVFKVSPQKIAVIYHGFNPQYGQPLADQIRTTILERYHINSPFFLYIGRLEEKKNTPRLVEGFGRFKQKDQTNSKLVLIGKPAFGFEKVREVIKRWGIEDAVIMPGWVGDSDLPALMKSASAFLFPSLYEGFGIPILEAMASGTPVITSNIGAMKEIAQDAALLIDPYNSEAIMLALRQLTENSALRQRFTKQGLVRATQFSWQITAQNTLQAIMNLSR